MNHIIAVLKQMPIGLRGFTINVGSFVNSTYNLQLATEIHCQTGLNFILDTSRNGGKITFQLLPIKYDSYGSYYHMISILIKEICLI